MMRILLLFLCLCASTSAERSPTLSKRHLQEGPRIHPQQATSTTILQNWAPTPAVAHHRRLQLPGLSNPQCTQAICEFLAKIISFFLKSYFDSADVSAITQEIADDLGKIIARRVDLANVATTIENAFNAANLDDLSDFQNLDSAALAAFAQPILASLVGDIFAILLSPGNILAIVGEIGADPLIVGALISALTQLSGEDQDALEAPGVDALLANIDTLLSGLDELLVKLGITCILNSMFPTAAPTQMPTGGGGGIFDSICFSEQTTVEVQGKGVISMTELQVGDLVRDAGESYTQVYGFFHYQPQAYASYLRLKLVKQDEASNHKKKATPSYLEVSKQHLVFVNGQARAASEVKVGDTLGDRKVQSIQTVQSRGIYAPATYSGSLLVDKVLVSTYISFVPQVPLNEHTHAHVVMAYHRLLGRLGLAGNGYTPAGYSYTAWPAIALAETVADWSSAVWQTLVCFLLVGPLVGTLYAVEQVAFTPALLVCAVGLYGWYRLQQRQASSTKKVKVV